MLLAARVVMKSFFFLAYMHCSDLSSLYSLQYMFLSL